METLILFILFIAIGYALFRSLTANNPMATQSQQTDPQVTTTRQRPRYDDPTIESRGGFGRDTAATATRYVRLPGAQVEETVGTVDSDRVKSRGGFGRDRR